MVKLGKTGLKLTVAESAGCDRIRSLALEALSTFEEEEEEEE
jgi:hypothetical protein